MAKNTKRSSKKKQQIEAVCDPRDPNFHGLRDILFEELNLLRANRISVGRARVTSQLARRIIEAATLDLFAQRLLGNGDPEELKRLVGENVQN